MLKSVFINSYELLSADDVIVIRLNDCATVILKPEKDDNLAAVANISNSSHIDDCLKPLIKKIMVSSYHSEKNLVAMIVANSDLNLIEDIEDYLHKYKINLNEVKTFDQPVYFAYSIKKWMIYQKNKK